MPTSSRGGQTGSRQARIQALLRQQATQGPSPTRRAELRSLGQIPPGRSPGRSQVKSTGGPGAGIAGGILSLGTTILGGPVYTADEANRIRQHPLRETKQHPLQTALAVASVLPVEQYAARGASTAGSYAARSTSRKLYKQFKTALEAHKAEHAQISKWADDLEKNRPHWPQNSKEELESYTRQAASLYRAHDNLLRREQVLRDYWQPKVPIFRHEAMKDLIKQMVPRSERIKGRAQHELDYFMSAVRQHPLPTPRGPRPPLEPRIAPGEIPGHVPEGFKLNEEDPGFAFKHGNLAARPMDWSDMSHSEYNILMDYTDEPGRKLLRAQMEHGIGGRPYRPSDTFSSQNIVPGQPRKNQPVEFDLHPQGDLATPFTPHGHTPNYTLDQIRSGRRPPVRNPQDIGPYDPRTALNEQLATKGRFGSLIDELRRAYSDPQHTLHSQNIVPRRR